MNYRLDRMSDLRAIDCVGTRPRDFDLDAYSARSFGAFQAAGRRLVAFAPGGAAAKIRMLKLEGVQLESPQPAQQCFGF